MLTALLTHARFDAALQATGDLHVDEHHTVEDVGIVIGSALDQALGDRRGIARFGDAHAPLDEALARAVLDFSGRPCAVIELGLVHAKQGEVLSENLSHFLQSLAMAGRLALHVDVLRGQNDHHKAEAAFKAVALALHRATRQTAGGVPSTKGVL
jgi:imidazoleglycerol-phosphate dehydratase